MNVFGRVKIVHRGKAGRAAIFTGATSSGALVKLTIYQEEDPKTFMRLHESAWPYYETVLEINPIAEPIDVCPSETIRVSEYIANVLQVQSIDTHFRK